jgi:hypothetical protein
LRGTNESSLNLLWYWGRTEDPIDSILMMKAAHFNAVRFCQHVAFPEVREVLDRLGMLSEQDQGGGRDRTSAGIASLAATGPVLARATWNNPGVILLSYANESWFDPRSIADAVWAVDPERVLLPISGAHIGEQEPRWFPWPDAYWDRAVYDFHNYAGWYSRPGEIWTIARQYLPGRMVIVGEFGGEALDGYRTMAESYPSDFGPTPPGDADALWGAIQVQSRDRRQFVGFRGRIPTDLDEYIVASQRYQADMLAEMATGFRLSPRRIAGYFQFHFQDVVPVHWPKSIVSNDFRPKLAYYDMATINQPVVPLFLLQDRGQVMQIWVANDTPVPLPGAHVSWDVRDGERSLVRGEFTVDVPASDAVRAVDVALASVPADLGAVTMVLTLSDAGGATVSEHRREVFLRAWRSEVEMFSPRH